MRPIARHVSRSAVIVSACLCVLGTPVIPAKTDKPIVILYILDADLCWPKEPCGGCALTPRGECDLMIGGDVAYVKLLLCQCDCQSSSSSSLFKTPGVFSVP